MRQKSLMDERSAQRLEELKAAAPVKRRKGEPFVMVPVRWATEAAKATQTTKAMVWVLLLHIAWKRKSTTFPLSNGELKAAGVNREAKRRILRKLEAAGLIIVDRKPGRAPRVTLVGL